jgi:hypothetical protein
MGGGARPLVGKKPVRRKDRRFILFFYYILLAGALWNNFLVDFLFVELF